MIKITVTLVIGQCFKMFRLNKMNLLLNRVSCRQTTDAASAFNG